MATNPMQRKARNSFLMGMLVMLLIAAVIIGGLLYLLFDIKNKETQEEQTSRTVYVLKSDVQSGNKIDESMVTMKTVAYDTSPSDYASNFTDVVAKIDLKAGTVVSTSMLSKSDEKVNSDTRQQEYNMIVLPTTLQDGDVIDIRLMLPTGHDYIVISKKAVSIPLVAGAYSNDTIIMNLSEDEIIIMSNAIVEAYMMNGAKLYATKYVEAGMQNKASLTYQVSSSVGNAMNNNPNILDEAKQALNQRYNETNRSYIQANLNQYSDSGLSTYESSLSTQIQNQKDARKKYLDSLTAGAIY